uniref:Uncharacterized protein n=1 Tax=Romanomermis culicivorax TaxID=13658 RepID=A0A915J5C6_ROMCU
MINIHECAGSPKKAEDDQRKKITLKKFIKKLFKIDSAELQEFEKEAEEMLQPPMDATPNNIWSWTPTWPTDSCNCGKIIVNN